MAKPKKPSREDLGAVVVFMKNVAGRTIQSGERINLDDTATVQHTDAHDKVILMHRGIFATADETVLSGNIGRFEVDLT